MPEISVVIPVFNQESYVAECITSLQNQTYGDLEFIVVDDGSTDNSMSIIQEETDGDERFVILRQNNAGVSVARNNGMNHANGTWISFMDPDDRIVPDYFEVLHKTVEECDRRMDVIMSACTAFDESMSQAQHFFPESFVIEKEQDKIPLYHQLMDGRYAQSDNYVTAIGVPWGKLYNREFLIRDNLIFDKRLRRMQDNLFNMQVFHAATNMLYIDYSGYEYRIDSAIVRSYKNAAKGAYRNALDLRELLMNQYGLLKYPELANAMWVEQANQYFQEVRAVISLAPFSAKERCNVAKERLRELRNRVDCINSKALSGRSKIRYEILRHPLLAKAYAIIKTIKSWGESCTVQI